MSRLAFRPAAAGDLERIWDRVAERNEAAAQRLIAWDDLGSLCPAVALADTYVAAVRLAALETGFTPRRFPQTCPFTIEELLDPDFLPN
jgi:hypothetical protein